MLNTLFAAGRGDSGTETDGPAVDWDRRDGFRLDGDDDVEAIAAQLRADLAAFELADR